MTDPLRIGALYPLHSAEDDYPRLGNALDPAVDIRVVHTASPNLHRIDHSLVTGSKEYLLAGARELRQHAVAACMWACTASKSTRKKSAVALAVRVSPAWQVASAKIRRSRCSTIQPSKRSSSSTGVRCR